MAGSTAFETTSESAGSEAAVLCRRKLQPVPSRSRPTSTSSAGPAPAVSAVSCSLTPPLMAMPARRPSLHPYPSFPVAHSANAQPNLSLVSTCHADSQTSLSACDPFAMKGAVIQQLAHVFRAHPEHDNRNQSLRLVRSPYHRGINTRPRSATPSRRRTRAVTRAFPSRRGRVQFPPRRRISRLFAITPVDPAAPGDLHFHQGSDLEPDHGVNIGRSTRLLPPARRYG
jgi:hypothetical protein